MKSALQFQGSNFFRQRIVLSTLSGRPIKIKNIRSNDEEPGVKEYEVTFLKIMDSITNGSKVEINATGTEVTYIPGLLQGGNLDQQCDNERCISYFLEPLIYLGPFSKYPLRVKLRGVTNNQLEPSVDNIKSSWIPIMRHFILNDESLELKVTKRGLPPEGGGEVTFNCPSCRQLRPVQLQKMGKVKKIRGLAFACKVSPLMTTRMIETAKNAVKPLLSDTYITSDHRKGAAGGNSPGYGMVLTAETTEGVVYVGEAVSNPRGATEPSTPEDVGQKAAFNLMDEIYRGGCVNSTAQSLSSLFMVLGEKNVSKLVSGPLSNYTTYMLRHLKDFMDVTFKLENFHPLPMESAEEDEELRVGSEDKVMMICVGSGYTNINKTLL